MNLQPILSPLHVDLNLDFHLPGGRKDPQMPVSHKTSPKEFAKAISEGSALSIPCQGLRGRLIRGKESADFSTLSDDPHRKIVMVLGDDGLSQLTGKSGYEMLIAIGYTAAHIERKVISEGNQFKLVVFPDDGPAAPATWSNVIDFVSELYPELESIVRGQASKLSQNSFWAIESLAGYKFADVDKAGRSDPRFMTAERLLRSGGSLVEVRAFLYHSVHLRELFSGDGFTYDEKGVRGLREYIVKNMNISDIPDAEVADIKIEIPGKGKKGQSPMNTAAPKYELPVPDFFDPSKVGEVWRVPYQERFAQALAWAKRHQILPAVKDATDGLRIAVMPIDGQNTFCIPGYELFVGGRSSTGAVDDNVRLTQFYYRNLRVITQSFPTMDTHTIFQIFHSLMWVNDQGENPAPFSQISLDDIEKGRWKINPEAAYAVTGDPQKYMALQKHALHYARKLSQGGKYLLTIWPYHAMLGGIGHALVSSLEEALFFHGVARRIEVKHQIKGGNPLTENYSVIRPEVMETAGGHPIGSVNTDFLETLFNFDVLVIAGQAKSHCVAWTIDDILDWVVKKNPALAKKIYILEDCSSPVVVPGVIDFTDQANDAYRRFAAAGMNVVKSTTPISEWPGIDRTRLGA